MSYEVAPEWVHVQYNETSQQLQQVVEVWVGWMRKQNLTD